MRPKVEDPGSRSNQFVLNTMEKSPQASSTSQKSYDPKTKLKAMSFNYSPHHSIFVLIICLSLFLLFEIQSLLRNQSSVSCDPTRLDDRSMVGKLREGVTFLPLKDLRYSSAALKGHTWFMSSMYDTHEEGEVQYQKFPSKASKGRILCLKGRDTHDGSWNYYALAWPEALPHNATLINGLTFVSYNHYNYENIWHGLSAVFPFVGWHLKNGCRVPSRWVLYHWGELRTKMGLWLTLLLEATFGGPINIEKFEGVEDDQPVCFKEAVVMRHNEGGMSRERRVEVYDHMRCKARLFCNVSLVGNDNDPSVIGMTLLMRSGARSFRNNSAVIEIFKSECLKVQGCHLMVAYSNNLTFCQQVKLMRLTDVLVSPHGAQLTNMFLMERNSSLMEFFPKGWLKLAGIGQYVYHWMASWSGMKHQGAYRDSNGDPQECPHPEDDRRCMPIFKGAQIGHDEAQFREWASKVLNEVKIRKWEEASNMNHKSTSKFDCSCHSK